MKPNRQGIWEWFEEDGTKHLVYVCNAMKNIPHSVPWLRVYWWGGYYNVNDEHDPETPQYDKYTKAEWPDRWGKFVNELGNIPDEELYLSPTPEQREKIMKKYETR